MARDAQTTNPEVKTVDRNISTLNFQYRRSGGPDNDMFPLVNAVCNRPENADDPPTLLFRKLIKRVCRLITGKAESDDIEFFRRYLQAAENSQSRPQATAGPGG